MREEGVKEHSYLEPDPTFSRFFAPLMPSVRSICRMTLIIGKLPDNEDIANDKNATS